jgi:hypothetical protein
MTTPSGSLAEPLTASRFFSAVRPLDPVLGFVLAPSLLILIVLAAIAEGDFTASGNFSRVSDIRHLLGLPSRSISAPVMPLFRDGLTLTLALLVGFTFACAYAQCRVIAVCIPDLEHSGVLNWRSSPRLDLAPRFLRRSAQSCLHTGTTSRLVFADWLERRMSRLRRTEPVLLVVAAILAAALQFAILKVHPFEVLAPRSDSAVQRQTWGSQAYDAWWASYHHWPGAVTFFLVATFGIFVILLQNAVLTAIVATASVLFAFAEPGVDWFNADGHYGWLPVERVFRASYLSIGLRGVSLSVLIIGFGERNTALFLAAAIIWLVFVLVYHVIPYRLLFIHLNAVRQVRINTLVRESRRFRTGRGIRQREAARFYATEIQRVREARINPMHLPKWQLSTFGIAVLLPIILTIIQIAF